MESPNSSKKRQPRQPTSKLEDEVKQIQNKPRSSRKSDQDIDESTKKRFLALIEKESLIEP